jgi:hypothetical protein
MASVADTAVQDIRDARHLYSCAELKRLDILRSEISNGDVFEVSATATVNGITEFNSASTVADQDAAAVRVIKAVMEHRTNARSITDMHARENGIASVNVDVRASIAANSTSSRVNVPALRTFLKLSDDASDDAVYALLDKHVQAAEDTMWCV